MFGASAQVMKVLLLLAGLAGLAAASATTDAGADGQVTIHLRHAPGGKVHIPAGRAHGLEPTLAQMVTTRRSLHEMDAQGLQVLVTLTHTIDEGVRERLAAVAGAPACGFLPERTLVYYLTDPTRAEQLAAVEGVARVDHMQPAYKASPGLYAALERVDADPDARAHPGHRAGHATLRVTLVSSWQEGGAVAEDAVAAALATWAPALAALGGDGDDGGPRVLGRTAQVVLVQAPLAAINSTVAWLAVREEVHGIGMDPLLELRNSAAQWVTQSGTAAAGTSVWAKGINGTGQLVGVSDGGFDLTNCLLANEVADDTMGFGPTKGVAVEATVAENAALTAALKGGSMGAHAVCTLQDGTIQVCTECTVEDFYDTSGVDYGISDYNGKEYGWYYGPYDSDLHQFGDPEFTRYCEWSRPECTTPSSGRKVAAYYAFAYNNEARDADGHGTHCAGSVAGAAASDARGGTDVNRFQGLAPGARLALVDMSFGPTGGLMYPPGNDTVWFDWAYNLGARLHSASWGGSWLYSDGYDSYAANIDYHTFLRKDSLVFFAASNDGSEGGYGSIQPESQAKNVVTVGATRMPRSQIGDWSKYESTYAFDLVLHDVCPGGELREVAYDYIQSALETCGHDPALYEDNHFDVSLCWNLKGLPLAKADPDVVQSRSSLSAHICGSGNTPGALASAQETYCCPPPQTCACITNCSNPDDDVQTWCNVDPDGCPYGSLDGSFFWMYCSTLNTTSNAANAGELGVAIYSFVTDWLGMGLGAYWGTSCCTEQHVADLAARSDFFNEEGTSLAVFSSRGPTWDGRIKPDVLAPGWTISAKSQQTNPDPDFDAMHCDVDTSVGSMMGTSMSTPVAAGLAALVRQYFEEGFHACGTKDETKAIRPSAALVKAVLISSARRPTSLFTLHDADGFHGDCQPFLVEDWGAPDASTYCKANYGRPTAVCTDISGLLKNSDGTSIFCDLPGNVANGGCEHELHCCMKNKVPNRILRSLTYEDFEDNISQLEPYFVDYDKCFEAYGYNPTPMGHPTVAAALNATRPRMKRSDGSSGGGSRRLKEHDEDMLEGEHVELGSDPEHVHVTGHGQVDDGKYLVGTGEMVTYEVQLPDVPPTGGFLRATLVWTDPPGSVSTGHGVALVNDLDLEVQGPDPGAALVFGNAMYSLPDEVLDGGRDRVNNVEVVHLEAPAAGKYTIRVSGHQVVRGKQEYALVVNFVHGGTVKCAADKGAFTPVSSLQVVSSTTNSNSPPAPPLLRWSPSKPPEDPSGARAPSGAMLAVMAALVMTTLALR